MKKVYFNLIVAIVILIGLSFAQKSNKDKLSNLTFMNIEALATGEIGGELGVCYRTIGYSHFIPSVLIFYCYGCTWVNAVTYQDISVCY